MEDSELPCPWKNDAERRLFTRTFGGQLKADSTINMTCVDGRHILNALRSNLEDLNDTGDVLKEIGVNHVRQKHDKPRTLWELQKLSCINNGCSALVMADNAFIEQMKVILNYTSSF